jgi:hypothetical protein
VIWYGGHGAILNGTTQIMVNEKELEKRYYPFELNLNHFSNYKHTYTILIMDCCRSLFKQNDTGVGRGKESEENLAAKLGQIKIVYACQPCDMTRADSKLSEHVLEDIERQLKENGYIQTISHHHIRTKNTKIDTRDNVEKLLHLQVEGNVPIPGAEEENLILVP